MESLLILAALFGLMWFLFIRPQQRRVKDHEALVSSIAPGDQVVTVGGLHATVVEALADDLRIELSPGVVVRLARPAISRKIVADDDTDSQSGDDSAEEPPAADAS